MGGIADALSAGDINLAAQILWLSLKLAWQQGVAALNRAWLEAKRFFLSIVYGMWHGALTAAEIGFHALEVAWIETTSFLSQTAVHAVCRCDQRVLLGLGGHGLLHGPHLPVLAGRLPGVQGRGAVGCASRECEVSSGSEVIEALASAVEARCLWFDGAVVPDASWSQSWSVATW